MQGNKAYRSSDIDELESHLLDVMDELKKEALTEEEAFQQAIQQMGDVDSLNEEFLKVNYRKIWIANLTQTMLIIWGAGLLLYMGASHASGGIRALLTGRYTGLETLRPLAVSSVGMLLVVSAVGILFRQRILWIIGTTVAIIVLLYRASMLMIHADICRELIAFRMGFFVWRIIPLVIVPSVAITALVSMKKSFGRSAKAVPAAEC